MDDEGHLEMKHDMQHLLNLFTGTSAKALSPFFFSWCLANVGEEAIHHQTAKSVPNPIPNPVIKRADVALIARDAFMHKQGISL